MTACFYLRVQKSVEQTFYQINERAINKMSRFLRQRFLYLLWVRMQKTIYSPEYSLLLEWLRTKRNEQGLSMRDLGRKLNSYHSWIDKVEQGERRLDILEYLRICKALEIDPHEGVDILSEHCS